jgi:hypothetical protein
MDQESAPTPLSPTDQCLLLAARVWARDLSSTFWDVFPTDRRAALRWAWTSRGVPGADAARERLKEEHTAQARPDLARVHVSWWARALKEEPRSVRNALVANLPAGIAEALREELENGPEDTPAERPPHAVALRAALALWSERLVGDVPKRDDDPPVIAVLTGFEAPLVARFIRTAGLAKWSLTDSRPKAIEASDQRRLERLNEMLSDIDPPFRLVATADVASLNPGASNPESRLGLTTVARLLCSAEPYRVRWTLQHLPYTTAKAIRTLMGPHGRRAPMVALWETLLLRASWLLLQQDRWISEPWRWESQK